jgi:hypothetical protein
MYSMLEILRMFLRIRAHNSPLCDDLEAVRSLKRASRGFVAIHNSAAPSVVKSSCPDFQDVRIQREAFIRLESIHCNSSVGTVPFDEQTDFMIEG